MMNAITLCSGGGLVDIALRDLGLELVAAVEYDRAIAGVYRGNHGDHVRVEDLCATDFATFPAHTVGWVSPPCPNFSQAKTGGAETETDRALAGAICRYLRACRPPVFVLENVRGYRKSASLLRIVHTLLALDYAIDIQIVNAADYGVPQTRERLILRARLMGGMPPLPAPVPWVGWYAAIEDLLPTLPPSAFAPWQLARLPAELTENMLVPGANDFRPQSPDKPAITITGNAIRIRAFLVAPANTSSRGDGWPPASPPALTVCAGFGVHGQPRAFIVDCQNNGAADADGRRGLTVPDGQAPMFTVTSTQTKRQVRAFLMGGGNTSAASLDGTWHSGPRDADEPAFTVTQASKRERARVIAGRVVQMTPRALARFQSVPDSYRLPDKAALACQVIGNGVPVLMARAIVAGLLNRSAP